MMKTNIICKLNKKVVEIGMVMKLKVFALLIFIFMFMKQLALKKKN